MKDEQLVKEFLEGNDEALEVLVGKYLKPIYNFILQMTRDTGAAEDISQDVFVRMWANAKSFDESKKFSTWIFAIAKNAALDWLKKKKAIPFVLFERIDGTNVLDYIEDESSLGSCELLQRMDNTNDARELLDSLSLELRTIMHLHHEQGFTLVEIAEIVGSPSNTVKSKYRRALLLLRNLYSSKQIILAKNQE